MRPLISSQSSVDANRDGSPRSLGDAPDTQDIPPCLVPLQTLNALTEYATLARLLSQVGRLTPDTQRALSEYAAQFDGLHVSLARGMPIRPSRFDQLRRARKALRLRDLETQALSQPQQEPTPNKFAIHGFASRNRLMKVADDEGHL